MPRFEVKQSAKLNLTSYSGLALIGQCCQAARDAFAASSSSAVENTDRSVEAQLAEIRARGPVNRSQQDHDFLFANDKRLAEIS